MAWTGGAVTLLGVALLLVLAASRGWFSPPARVGAGVALGVVLVGLGCWLHRRESARTGAVALAATGFATGYLVLAAATAIYGYLTPVPALLPRGEAGPVVHVAGNRPPRRPHLATAPSAVHAPITQYGRDLRVCPARGWSGPSPVLVTDS